MTPGAILDRIARVTPKRTESKAPLRFLPHPIRGLIAFSLLSLNTVAGSMAILPLALVKLVVPIPAVRKRIDPMLNAIVEWWIEGNGRWISLMQDVEWEVEGVEQLRPDGWYLVVANHQSWADVFVLQKVLNRRIPLVKFTLKRVLIWVPFAGLAWWALDFPFMSRHSEEFLRRNPERRGEDLAAIRKACEKYLLVPTAVGNFLEGTRFTPEKHAARGADYRHLLRPRAGGIALALDSMGEQFEALIDVTIFYPDGAPTFFQFLEGRMKRVVVKIRELPIQPELIGGDYANDPEYQERVRSWVNQLWREKDELLDSLSEEWQ